MPVLLKAHFLIDEMDVEVIADGVHLPAPLLKLIFKIKGPGRIALITDAMRAAGMPPGESVIGNLHTGLKVIVEDGVSKLPDRSSFAGSVATADRLVRTMINMGGVSLTDAVRMITKTPAEIMNIADRKGSLAVGKDADIVIFDENIFVQTTMVKGKIIYQSAICSSCLACPVNITYSDPVKLLSSHSFHVPLSNQASIFFATAGTTINES